VLVVFLPLRSPGQVAREGGRKGAERENHRAAAVAAGARYRSQVHASGQLKLNA